MCYGGIIRIYNEVVDMILQAWGRQTIHPEFSGSGNRDGSCFLMTGQADADDRQPQGGIR
jgi:hypothetical protein